MKPGYTMMFCIICRRTREFRFTVKETLECVQCRFSITREEATG